MKQLTLGCWPRFHPEPTWGWIDPPPHRSSTYRSPITLPTWARLLRQLSLGSVLGLWVIGVGLGAAVAQGNLGQVWSGRGQILSGQGQGATVDLVLEMREGRLLTQSGPRLNAPYSGGATTINNPEGLWQIEPQGDRLSVTLQRGDQLIRYQLFPNRPLLQQAPLQRRLAPAAPQSPTQTGSSSSEPQRRRSLGDGSIIRGILGN